MLLRTDDSGSGVAEAKAFVILKNTAGLHCRPAGAFVRTAKSFRSSLTLTHARKEANGKSILDVMGLEARKGSLVVIKATGDDAQEAVQALQTLVHNNLGEPD